jgi:GntR family transcriptional regulator
MLSVFLYTTNVKRLTFHTHLRNTPQATIQVKKSGTIQGRDKRPLYIQAISAITEMIESGELGFGSQLPSEGELSEMLGISRSTLREALGHLETFGMVTRQPGRGTFVTAPQGLGGLERLEPFRTLAEQAKKSHQVIDRQANVVPASPEMAKCLNVEPDVKLVCIQVVEAIGEIPCMYFEDYLIEDRVSAKSILSYKGSSLTYMIEQRQPPLSYARSKIFAIGASKEIADRLAVEEGQPILQLVETYYDAVGEVLGMAFTYTLTDQFYFYVTRRVFPH